MKNIKFDSALLFALLIPFVMTYRISPGITPYWLFGLLFFGLFIYIFLDTGILKIKETVVSKIKFVLLWLLILGSIGAGLYSAIIVRHQTTPIYGVHDIVLQQESAIQFFLHGKNPYATTYFGTPLQQWHYSDTETNPALYYFVMEPFYMLFAVPFYLVMGHGIGFFDARVPLFFLFLSILVMIGMLVKDADKKRQFMILFAFNPATLGYFLEGRDDIFMFAFLFAGLLLLQKRQFIWAQIPIALAFAIKQSAWPFFPFYLAYLYFETYSWKRIFKYLCVFAAVFGGIVLPFFLWNPKAFVDSTIYYLSGNVAHAYPIAGYGFGMLLNQVGFIKNLNAYYPFWIWQAIIALPLLVVLILWQRKENSLQRLLLAYGLFLFVFWYFSRYFHNSHLGYLSMIFIAAYFWPQNSSKEGKN